MGSVNFSLNRELALFFQRHLGIQAFIETGTFQGTTTAIAAGLFPIVHTIEASPTLFKENATRLNGYPNIRQHLGDSPKVLRQIQSEYLDKSCLFWLDAHWCNAPNTARVNTECPVLEELQSIQNLGAHSVILIDDARLFAEGPPSPHKPEDWPDLSEISVSLTQLSKEHRLTIFDDTLVYAPKRLNAELATFRDEHKSKKTGNDLDRASTTTQYQAIKPERIFLNKNIEKSDHASLIFSRLLEQNNIKAFLDIGAHKGEFASKVRMHGYSGTIYSIEPVARCHSDLRKNSAKDHNWIILPQQAAGLSDATTSINLSANSYSSSFLKVTKEHLAAAPQARIVSAEKCYITKTKNILSSLENHKIRALKIDTQGFEDRVIKGLENTLENISLVMVEMNAYECYEDCLDMISIDQLLVKEYGFKRISLEPSFYNERESSCQQYDGIYFRISREDSESKAPTNAIAGVTDNLITSTAVECTSAVNSDVAKHERWLKVCAESWTLIANKTYSVSEINPHLPQVCFIETPVRPSIFELLKQLETLATDKSEQCILTNADIAFTASFQRLLPTLDKTVIYFGNRTDVISQPQNNLHKELGTYSLGYDFFVIPQKFAPFLANAWKDFQDFKIGSPWWDYLFPIASLSLGIPTKRLCSDEALALHQAHATKYSRSIWLEYGLHFIEAIKSIDSLRTNRAKVLTSEILSCFDGNNSKDLHLALTATSRLILDYF